jgi:hypothetical protein
MLIDDYLLNYDVAARYGSKVQAPAAHVYQVVRNVDLGESAFIRLLFRLREFPAISKQRDAQAGLGLRLDDLLRSGFILLDENGPHEILLGVVGRFWTSSGCIQRMDAKSFRAFEEQGFAKAVWNFSLSEREIGLTELATETRVRCLDDASRRKFRLYWTLIGPFSGLIRREILRIVQQQAEASWAANRPS